MSKQGDNRNIRVLQFLDAYEKQESLWNPAKDGYKNKATREEAYINIIHELKVPSLSIHDVKLKVKSIRTTYTKELRLLTKHMDEGKSYNPKLFWFHRANTFLRNVSLSRVKRTQFSQKIDCPETYRSCDMEYITKICREQNGLDDEPSDESSNVGVGAANTSSTIYECKSLHAVEHSHTSENVCLSGNHTDHTSDSPSHNQIITTNFKQINPINTDTVCSAPNILISNQSALANEVNAGDDEYDIFCRSIAMQLRGITDFYSRCVAKLKIQQILFEAEIGNYKNTTSIIIDEFPPRNNS